MPDFVMPTLGADMEAGTLVAWRKQPGDAVAHGEIIAEVETEKGVIEVECFTAGTVESHLVAAGTKVPVGTRLAVIREGPASATAASTLAAVAVSAGGPVPSAPPSSAHATPSARVLLREHALEAGHIAGTGSHGTITRADVLAAAVPRPAPAAPVASAEPQAPGTRLRISPLARRLAETRGLSLSGLTASGPSGSVVAVDVLRHAPATQQPSPASDGKARMRRAIAQSMSRSKREIPHYYLSHTVDLGKVMAWLEAQNETLAMPDRLLPGVLFVRAVALAVKKVPELNAHWLGSDAPPMAEVHVGVAVSLRGGGLVVPAIQHVDRLSLSELASRFKDVINRARTGQLRSSELSSATLTITSLGERGVETVFPIIIPPQVGMVGFGSIIQRPMVVEGAVLARPTVTLTLAADHRVTDGHRGGLFLAAVASFLEEPPKP